MMTKSTLEALRKHSESVSESVKEEFRTQASHFAEAVGKQLVPQFTKQNAQVDKAVRGRLMLTEEQLRTLAGKINTRTEVKALCDALTKAVASIQQPIVQNSPPAVTVEENPNLAEQFGQLAKSVNELIKAVNRPRVRKIVKDEEGRPIQVVEE